MRIRGRSDSFFFFNAVTSENSTKPHVRKWARFENGCLKFGSLPLKLESKKLLILLVVLQRFHDLRANIFWCETSYWQRNILSTATGLIHFFLKLGELWPTNSKIQSLFWPTLTLCFRLLFIQTKITEWNSTELCYAFGSQQCLKGAWKFESFFPWTKNCLFLVILHLLHLSANIVATKRAIDKRQDHHHEGSTTCWQNFVNFGHKKAEI